ncbi:MAG: NADH-quinone oxidoreductase subunit C [Desulfobacter sp.]|nr:MAG: NADH-quinone oxidoreductase subunit C [Desulfobacter sp.]
MKANTITKESLTGEFEKLKSTGWRLVTITCLEIDQDTLEIIYHFDKNLELANYRMQVGKNETIPSLSPVFFSAFLVENEIIDLYGVKFDGLVLDFGGTLYLDREMDNVTATPFCKFGVTRTDK